MLPSLASRDMEGVKRAMVTTKLGGLENMLAKELATRDG